MNDAQRRLLRGLAFACRDDLNFANHLSHGLWTGLRHSPPGDDGSELRMAAMLEELASDDAPALEIDQILAAIDPLDMELASASVLTAVLAIFEATPPDRPLSPAARAFVAWSLDLVGRRLTAELGART